MPEDRLSKSQRQEAAREKARAQRDADQKKAKRKRLVIQSSVAVGVIAVTVIVALVIINMTRTASSTASAVGPNNMISDGVIIGSGLAAQRTAANGPSASPTDQAASASNRLVVYLDYQCPNCANFEATNNSQISTWVSSGKLTLEIRPLSFLDKSSLNNYSSRAANAAACVANYAPDSFFAFNSAMFSNQPAEGTAGPSDSEITSLIAGVTGGSNSDIASCISNETYGSWVKAATNRGIGQPNEFGLAVTGTPAVFFNGTALSGNITTDPTALAAVVNPAIG